jgi:hypothetical protein
VRGRLLALVFTCSLPLVPACSSKPQVTPGLEDAARAKAELKKQLGLNSSLMYGYTQAEDGGPKRLDVQVRYSQRPEGDLAQVREKTEEIVRKNFHDPVTSVTVLF